MDIANVYSVYFNATGSTKSVVCEMAHGFAADCHEIDITAYIPASPVMLSGSDLLVVGVPVYGGRVPQEAVAGLNAFKGNRTPVVIVCVYGNRDYDVALLELDDIVRANGFITIAATVYIAEHSIFRNIAARRPDMEDRKKLADFLSQVKRKLSDRPTIPDIRLPLKGTRPYKPLGTIPIHPSGGANVAMLFGDIAALNVFPFVAAPMFIAATGFKPEQKAEFFAARKKENVAIILSRIS